jgi:hypothetical protein
MEELIERCAGIDVGQAEVVICARVPDAVTGARAELIASHGTTPRMLSMSRAARRTGRCCVAGSLARARLADR